MNKFLSIWLILTILLTQIGFAQEETSRNLDLADGLKVQTIMFKTQLYINLKKNVKNKIENYQEENNRQVAEFEEADWDNVIYEIVKSEYENFETEFNSTEKKAKVKILKEIGSWVKNQVIGILKDLRNTARKDGVITAVSVIAGFVMTWVFPLSFAAMGAYAAASFFSVFPTSTVFAAAGTGLQSFFNRLKVRKSFRTKRQFQEFKKLSLKVMKTLKLRSDKSYIYEGKDGHFVVSKPGIIQKSIQLVGINKKRLSIHNLKRKMKKLGIYTDKVRAIRKSKRDYLEKLLLMLNHVEESESINFETKKSFYSFFETNMVPDLPTISYQRDVHEWVVNIDKVQKLTDLDLLVKDAPVGVPRLQILKIYQEFILPKLSYSIKGLKIGKFQKLFKNVWKLLVPCYEDVDLQWNASAVSEFYQYTNEIL